MAHPRHRYNLQQRVYPRLNTALRHRFPQGSGWLNKNAGSVWLFRQQGGKFRQPLWMSRPGGGGNQVTVHMRLVDTNIRIVPTAQAHFRSAGGIGASGPSLQNTGGGQQLRAVADGKHRLTAVDKIAGKGDEAFITTQLVGRVAPGQQ